MILRLNHLLEQNSGKVYFLGYWFMIKGYKSGTARWKRFMGQSRVGKGCGAPVPSLGSSFPTSLHSPARTVPWTCPFVIEWRSRYLGLIINSVSSPSPLRRGWGVRLKVPSFRP